MRRLSVIGVVLIAAVITPFRAAVADTGPVGHAKTDQMTYLQNGKMTVTLEVENNADDIWIVDKPEITTAPTSTAFSYTILSLNPNWNYKKVVRNGNLQPTGTYYVDRGASYVLATGAILLKDLPPGLYKITVTAPHLYQSVQNSTRGPRDPWGEAAFRIVPTGEAGTIHP